MKPFRLVLSAAAAAAGVVVLVRQLEDHLIFWPWRRLQGTPQDCNLPYEDVVLEPVSGVHIRGWFVPHPSPQGVVLYLEGNGANRSNRLGHVAALHAMGYTVLIMDYEGYGDSDGRPSETAVYRDAKAARAWLQADPRTQRLPLALFGESLGGAVSLYLAREEAPAALVVDHSFSTMAHMIDRVCRGIPLSRICRSRYNSLENVQHYHGPILILHGEADKFIPIEQGRQLFGAANSPKTFLSIPGAGHDHNEVLRIGGEKYTTTIRQFLDGAMAGHNSAKHVDTSSKETLNMAVEQKNLGYDDTPLITGTQYKVHDGTRPQPLVVTPGTESSPQAAGTPPSDAVVLFDGRDASKWTKKGGGSFGWKVENGYMEVVPGGGDVQSTEEFGDCQLHLEWAAPSVVKGDSQGRGNSGVFILGLYEIQVLDCYQNPTYADGTTAAVYGQYPPLVNACRKPGEWQTYDIIWTSPKFAGGEVVSPAYVTVIHNGIVVQNHVQLHGPTQHRNAASYKPHPETGPLTLQDHGDLVRYRNIWYRPLSSQDQK